MAKAKKKTVRGRKQDRAPVAGGRATRSITNPRRPVDPHGR
jgi:hypothetical protein